MTRPRATWATALALLPGLVACATALRGACPHDAPCPELSAQSAAASAPVAPARLQERGRVAIPRVEVDGIVIDELSGLAWDADAQRLYAVSDKGNVFHFRVVLQDDAIRTVEPVFAAALRDPRDPQARFNAEGLTVQNAGDRVAGNTLLVVALEDKDGPRIVRFDPAGVMRDALPVPPPAHRIGNYVRKGRGLESVALHPRHGLVTAPESPLQAQPPEHHGVFAHTTRWSFARHAPDSRLKALDVEDDGNLLALERTRTGDALTASVRRVRGCVQGDACRGETLAVLAPGADNFEGMTRLEDGSLLLVSDHGGRKDPRPTTLVLLSPP